MADNKSKKSGNRYSGVDSQPWVAKNTRGEELGKAATSFKEANVEAVRYREVTGEYAAAVRL